MGTLPTVVAAWVCVWGVIPAHAQAAGRDEGAARSDLPSRVRSVFASKCVECHGAALRKPKGRFGFVLDLGRVAADPRLVVPFKPDNSTLWTLIRNDEMPPPKAPTGPLTPSEKELIHDWIASGAMGAEGGENRARQPSDITPFERGLRWLGRFHILVIHFPIALLIAAVFAEAWAGWEMVRAPSPIVRFCILLGAVSAVAAAVLGWFHADYGGYGTSSARYLWLHRWTGTAAALSAMGIAVMSEIDVHYQRRSLLFRLLLCIGAIMVAMAAHLGGLLVHGEEFFDL
jgi:mono/diheme cytochrome c family protein